MKLALSQPNEIQHIRKFLNECGWLKELLKEIDDYLSPNPKNHIYCQSVLHEKIKSVLSKVPVENEVSQNEA